MVASHSYMRNIANDFSFRASLTCVANPYLPPSSLKSTSECSHRDIQFSLACPRSSSLEERLADVRDDGTGRVLPRGTGD